MYVFARGRRMTYELGNVRLHGMVSECTDRKAFQRNDTFKIISNLTGKASHGFKGTCAEDTHPLDEWVEAGDVVLCCKVSGLRKTGRAHFRYQVFLLHVLQKRTLFELVKALVNEFLDIGFRVEGKLDGLSAGNGICYFLAILIQTKPKLV